MPVYSAVAGFKRLRNIELIDIIFSLESVGERALKIFFFYFSITNAPACLMLTLATTRWLVDPLRKRFASGCVI